MTPTSEVAARLREFINDRGPSIAPYKDHRGFGKHDSLRDDVQALLDTLEPKSVEGEAYRGFQSAVSAIRSWAAGFSDDMNQRRLRAVAEDLETNRDEILGTAQPNNNSGGRAETLKGATAPDTPLWQADGPETQPKSDSRPVGEALVYLETEARRFASMYQQRSDGRNTFIMFADKIAALQPASDAEGLSHDAAIDALCGCAATVTALSYQEAIEGYFKLRGLEAPK